MAKNKQTKIDGKHEPSNTKLFSGLVLSDGTEPLFEKYNLKFDICNFLYEVTEQKEPANIYSLRDRGEGRGNLVPVTKFPAIFMTFKGR
jgi:hypothetical protein